MCCCERISGYPLLASGYLRKKLTSTNACLSIRLSEAEKSHLLVSNRWVSRIRFARMVWFSAICICDSTLVFQALPICCCQHRVKCLLWMVYFMLHWLWYSIHNVHIYEQSIFYIWRIIWKLTMAIWMNRNEIIVILSNVCGLSGTIGGLNVLQ